MNKLNSMLELIYCTLIKFFEEEEDVEFREGLMSAVLEKYYIIAMIPIDILKRGRRQKLINAVCDEIVKEAQTYSSNRRLRKDWMDPETRANF